MGKTRKRKREKERKSENTILPRCGGPLQNPASILHDILALLQKMDRAAHERLRVRFPKLLSIIDKVSQRLFDIIRNPIFAIVLSLIWVVLMRAEEVSIEVAIAISLMGFIIFIWICRSEIIRKFYLPTRIIVLSVIALILTVTCYGFGNWALRQGKRTEPPIIWKEPSPIIYGTQLSTIQLNATSPIDGSFAYYPGIGAILPIGTHPLVVFFNPKDKKYISVTKSVNLVVNPLPEVIARPKKDETDPIFVESQFREFKEIDEFIGRKNEIELRETFDFPNMLKFNIKLARRNITPTSVKASESEEIDAFFMGGQAMLDARYVKVQRLKRIEVYLIPGKIGIVNISQKYIQNRGQLARYCASPLLPQEIIQALKSLDETVEKNVVLMFDSLNESLSSDPRNILDDDNTASSFWGSASALYWTHFVQLKPKSETINIAIRKALKTDDK